MTKTATDFGALARSDAILRILDAISNTNSNSEERLVLEGIAYIAQQPSLRDKKCRVLRAFDSKEWLLDFHESLAYLQEMRRVELTGGRYALTAAGRRHLQTAIGEPPGRNLREETEQIQKISDTVRVALGL